MKFYRCQCGKQTAISSMGHPPCLGCPDCGTTLNESPAQHRAPVPHHWMEPHWRIDERTGDRWQERRCLSCMTTERVDPGGEQTPKD